MTTTTFAVPARERALNACAVARTVVRLHVPGSGVTMAVRLGEPVTLGRITDMIDGRTLDLAPLNHTRSISREHALLARHGSHVLIRDLHSTNGTFLNGMRLSPRSSYILKDGDELVLGGLRLVVAIRQF